MELTKETARKLYDTSPDWFKEQLTKAFGEKTFEKTDFRSIKTFKDACQALELDPGKVTQETDTKDEAAYKMIKVIVAAINQGWIPDWSNEDQKKWFPWFNVLSSGLGFQHSFYYYTLTFTYVGSRLCFESSEKAEHAGRQFIKLYENFIL
jgi:hypothetical protein